MGGPPKYGGALTEPFMTPSLTLAVPGQWAAESSESEINEQEPQQRGRLSTQREYWQAEKRRRVKRNKLDG